MQGAYEVVKLKNRTAGRATLPGKERYANRRIKRVEYDKKDARATAVAGRMRTAGVTETQARDTSLWSLDGYLRRCGILGKKGSPEEALASKHRETAVRFAEIYHTYSRSTGLPPMTAKGIGANLIGGLMTHGSPPTAFLDEEGIRKAEKAKGRWCEALGALREVERVNYGGSVVGLFLRVCVAGYDGCLSEYEVGVMREGLNALRRVV